MRKKTTAAPLRLTSHKGIAEATPETNFPIKPTPKTLCSSNYGSLKTQNDRKMSSVDNSDETEPLIKYLIKLQNTSSWLIFMFKTLFVLSAKKNRGRKIWDVFMQLEFLG